MMFQLLKKLLITVSISLTAVSFLQGESIRSYDISLSVDPAGLAATGTEEIVFVPEADTDRFMMHLYWNCFEEQSLFMMNVPRSASGRIDESARSAVTVNSVKINEREVQGGEDQDPTVYAVRHMFRKGAIYRIHVEFALNIPDTRLFRYGYSAADNIYWFSQWFPKAGVLNRDGSWKCDPFDYYREFNAERSQSGALSP